MKSIQQSKRSRARKESFSDRLIDVIDTGIRTFARHSQRREHSDIPEGNLTESQKAQSASLMRINHTGEVCAQGLYEGQALVARSEEIRSQLRTASSEERSHLDWCRTRLEELNSSPSILAPLFYGASVSIGVLTGLAGDRISLGFVEATEDQVCEHLDRHLEAISEEDSRSRAILERIRDDEQRHGENALGSGGVEFPQFIKRFMTLASMVMTETTKHI